MRRRERSERQTKILDTFEEAYKKYGFDGITLHILSEEKNGPHRNTVTKEYKPEGNLTSLDKVIQDVLRRQLERVHETVPLHPSGDLRDDLIDIISRYHAYYSKNPILLYLTADIARKGGDLKAILIEFQEDTINRLIKRYRMYQKQGRWSKVIQQIEDRDELNGALGVTFFGGVLTRVLFQTIGIEDVKSPFDPAVYVDHFLYGHGSDHERKIGLLREMATELEKQHTEDR